jgi:hypothetical protein
VRNFRKRGWLVPKEAGTGIHHGGLGTKSCAFRPANQRPAETSGLVVGARPPAGKEIEVTASPSLTRVEKALDTSCVQFRNNIDLLSAQGNWNKQGDQDGSHCARLVECGNRELRCRRCRFLPPPTAYPSPWICADVGTDEGKLHKISPVFRGGAPLSPANTMTWPVTVVTSGTSNGLTAPTLDISGFQGALGVYSQELGFTVAFQGIGGLQR